MMKRHAIGLLMMLPLLFLTGCDKVYEWHQNLTVTVETPDGERPSSVVWAASWEEGGNLSMGFRYGARGEAAILDLGATPAGPRYLFALLRGAGTPEYLGSVAPASISQQRGRVINRELFKEVSEKRDRAAGIIEVPPYQYPLLVTFDDIDDPASVKRVDPANLAASFGPGYALKSITLEITDEPVTEGKVEDVLGWLEAVGRERASLIPYPKGVSSSQLKDPQIQLLSPSAFSTELYK